MKSSTFYFSHDYNARTDTKIRRLLIKHGVAGYGIFWCLVEDLHNNDNCLPADYDTLAFEYRCHRETVESVVCDFELFQIIDGNFSSESVHKRMKRRSEISEKARAAANKRWNGRNANASKTDADALRLNGFPDAKERKGKETKGNKIVVDSNESTQSFSVVNVFVEPELNDVIDEFKKRMTQISLPADAFDVPEISQQFIDHYTTRGWQINGQRVFKWRPLINRWVERRKSLLLQNQKQQNDKFDFE